MEGREGDVRARVGGRREPNRTAHFPPTKRGHPCPWGPARSPGPVRPLGPSPAAQPAGRAQSRPGIEARAPAGLLPPVYIHARPTLPRRPDALARLGPGLARGRAARITECRCARSRGTAPAPARRPAESPRPPPAPNHRSNIRSPPPPTIHPIHPTQESVPAPRPVLSRPVRHSSQPHVLEPHAVPPLAGPTPPPPSALVQRRDSEAESTRRRDRPFPPPPVEYSGRGDNFCYGKGSRRGALSTSGSGPHRLREEEASRIPRERLHLDLVARAAAQTSESSLHARPSRISALSGSSLSLPLFRDSSGV